MKQLIATLCLYAIAYTGQCQTQINKTIPAEGITSASLEFEYADVTIKTWDKDEILITGTVNINLGKDDDAFDLDVKDKNGRISISTSVDTRSLRKGIFAKEGGKQIHITKDQTGDYECVTYGSKIENTLVITLPSDISLKSSSIYGSTNVEGFTKSINIDNTYGPVDATINDINKTSTINLSSIYAPVDLSIPATAKVDMELNTEFGQIYSDLDMEITTNRNMSKKMFGENIKSTLNGGGNKIKLASNYSKIYVREI